MLSVPACTFAGSGWLIGLSFRLLPTHSGIQSGPNGEGWRPRPHPVSVLRFELRHAVVTASIAASQFSAVFANR